ncbi:MAG: hypothetical protein AAB390_01395 [Patescibacteria group bacterium]
MTSNNVADKDDKKKESSEDFALGVKIGKKEGKEAKKADSKQDEEITKK